MNKHTVKEKPDGTWSIKIKIQIPKCEFCNVQLNKDLSCPRCGIQYTVTSVGIGRMSGGGGSIGHSPLRAAGNQRFIEEAMG